MLFLALRNAHMFRPKLAVDSDYIKEQCDQENSLILYFFIYNKRSGPVVTETGKPRISVDVITILKQKIILKSLILCSFQFSSEQHFSSSTSTPDIVTMSA